MRVTLTGVAIALVVAIAGCGGGGAIGRRSDKGEKGVRAVARGYIDALAARKFDHVCHQLMTEAARRQAGAGDAIACQRNMAVAADIIGKRTLNRWKSQVGEMKINMAGDRASSGGSGPSKQWRYRYTNGDWFIASTTGE